VAARFADDARDYLARFQCTFYSVRFEFQVVKSRRAKTYTDLRLAVEALLKAFVALRQPYSSGGKKLVSSIERGGHKLLPLSERASNLWKISISGDLLGLLRDCDELPIGLRYTLDAWDFREVREDIYYRTIGSDAWMKRLEVEVAATSKRLDQILGRRSRVLSGKELFAQMMGENFNKYRP
jgi:hypothetical protein